MSPPVEAITPTHAVRLLIGAARKAAEEMRGCPGPSWWAELAPLLERRAAAVEHAINAGDLREPERDATPAEPELPRPVVHVDVADLVTRQEVADALAHVAAVGYVAGLETRLEDLERTVRDYVTTPMPDHGHLGLEERIVDLERLLNGKLDELTRAIVPLRSFPQTIADLRAELVDVRSTLALEVLALVRPGTDGELTLAGRVDQHGHRLAEVERETRALAAMPIAEDVEEVRATLAAELARTREALAADLADTRAALAMPADLPGRVRSLERRLEEHADGRRAIAGRVAQLEAVVPVTLDDLGYIVERAVDGTVVAVHRPGLRPYALPGEVAELRGRLNRHLGEEHSTPVLVEQHFAELRRPRWWWRR